MPLVAYSDLPTYQTLIDQQHEVLTLERALHQDIRELHIGILNLMPDAALKATERQFMRLIGDSNQIVQFYVHLFSLPSIERSQETQEWIQRYYEDFSQIKSHGLDAMIISGANPQCTSLEKEAFWPELTEVIDWAQENVTSTLCACLATHAVVQYLYGLVRQPVAEKRWGVFSHNLTDSSHPLTRHMNTRFDVPHSRFNQISKAQFVSRGLKVLVESESVGVHIAVSPDGFRLVFFQGHPEYDDLSLLKEYQREVRRWDEGKRVDYPPFPSHYFSAQVQKRLTLYKRQLNEHKHSGTAKPAWPQQWLHDKMHNTWRDTALSTFNNWLGQVYQLTSREVSVPFMTGVDPAHPFDGQ